MLRYCSVVDGILIRLGRYVLMCLDSCSSVRNGFMNVRAIATDGQIGVISMVIIHLDEYDGATMCGGTVMQCIGSLVVRLLEEYQRGSVVLGVKVLRGEEGVSS
ncbi:hypothetical protein NDU88_005940 [Pleurodeles waltl]|uniref:Uncharacterized protein n=1 Tax=Pleurodeles waltl TaxID=8319 RepID=A0AAV7RQH5_PLEWA|nr:hypothetical protein NDU88_005940 [Pleurodeles waltl]